MEKHLQRRLMLKDEEKVIRSDLMPSVVMIIILENASNVIKTVFCKS